MSISAIGTFHVDRMSDVVVACGLTVFLVLIAKKTIKCWHIRKKF